MERFWNRWRRCANGCAALPISHWLCQDCLQSLGPTVHHHVLKLTCLSPSNDDSPRCEEPVLEARAVLQYTGLVRHMIQQWKYQQGHWVMPILSSILIDAVVNHDPYKAHSKDDVLHMPIPMHWIRRSQRGYNPPGMLAQQLARYTGAATCFWTLRRQKHRAPQHTLSRKLRQINMKDCFRVYGRVPQKVVLIDDVVTTGATLVEASRALRDAGAESISAWVIAHA